MSTPVEKQQSTSPLATIGQTATGDRSLPPLTGLLFPDDRRVAELWLHGRGPHTRRAYAADLGRLLDFRHKPFAAIGLADLQAFADHLGRLSAASQYRHLSAIKSLFAFACRIGYLAYDPAAALRLPPRPRRLAARILPARDIRRLIAAAAKPRDRAILTILYTAGLRVSELTALTRGDCISRPTGGQITVIGKGAKERVIRLTGEGWDAIALLLSDAPASKETPLARSNRGSPLSTPQLWRITRQAACRAGLEHAVSPHWLRHAHASHALEAGAPAHLVKQTLGHASLTATDAYLHARPDRSSAQYLQINDDNPVEDIATA